MKQSFYHDDPRLLYLHAFFFTVVLTLYLNSTSNETYYYFQLHVYLKALQEQLFTTDNLKTFLLCPGFFVTFHSLSSRSILIGCSGINLTFQI